MKGLGRGRRRGMGGTLEEDKGDTVIGGRRMQTSTGYPKLYRPKKSDHAEFLAQTKHLLCVGECPTDTSCK